MSAANEILDNVNADLLNLWQPMLLLSSLVGAALIVYGVTRILQLRHGGGGLWAAVLSIVAGTLLVNLVVGMMVAATNTLFAGSASAPSALTYSPPSSVAEPVRPYLVFAIHVTTLVGFYGIIRGTYLIHEIGRGRSQDSNIWAAVVHIVFGALAANIVATANALGLSMGPTVRGFVQTLLGAG